jgi:hypothetical protein
MTDRPCKGCRPHVLIKIVKFIDLMIAQFRANVLDMFPAPSENRAGHGT